MARLDPFLDRLFTEGGVELTFKTGAGAYVRTTEGPIPLLKQPLTLAQLVGAVGEIVPDELREDFPTEGVTIFGYCGPRGQVSIRFEKYGDAGQLFIIPDTSDEAGPAIVPSINGIEVSPRVEAAEGLLTAAADPPAEAPASEEAWEPPASVGAPVASALGRQEAGQWRPFANAAPVPVAASLVEAVPAPATQARVAMDRLLARMVADGASDLHLSSGCKPMLRIDGRIKPVPGQQPLSSDQLKAMLFSIAPCKNREEWLAIKDTDFAHETETARFRVNFYSDRNGIGAALRQIPHRILTTEELGLSQPILDLCALLKGLVVVTGPTGSGKSTTLAAMVDYVNRTRDEHIITIEDPIEFVHPNKRCLINQREVGVNTSSFKHALRAALREDPSVVLVGEMRDLETVSIAIETAETGHLVFGTLHTTTAASTVDRIIDQFPSERQSQIRTMLSESLKGVIAQTLCRKIGGGRVAALEVLLCSNAVSNLIREGKTFQIPSVMQINRGAGMVTLNDSLLDLVKQTLVEPDEAYLKSVSKVEFKASLERAGFRLTDPGKPVETLPAPRQPLRMPSGPGAPVIDGANRGAVAIGKLNPQEKTIPVRSPRG